MTHTTVEVFPDASEVSVRSNRVARERYSILRIGDLTIFITAPAIPEVDLSQVSG